MSHYRTSKVALFATVPLLVALLGACGAADNNPAAANTSGADGKQSSQSFDDWQLSFAECMRGKGVNVPDPSAGGVQLDSGGDPAAFAAAAQACRDKLGAPPARKGDTGSKMTNEQMVADQLKAAQCLRKKGYDVPDPVSGGTLSIPSDVPTDVLDACAPNGVVGPAAP